MPANDRQQPFAVKKVALRDLSNATRNIMTMAQGSSNVTKEEGPLPDAFKVSGIKRQHPDSTQVPRHQSTCTSNVNGHLVYVRRKLEEPGKPSNHVLDPTVCPMSREFCNGEQTKPNHIEDEEQEAKATHFPALSPISVGSLTVPSLGTSAPCMVGMALNGSPEMDPNLTVSSVAVPNQPNSLSSCNAHWKERFLRLQIFLNKCDQSNQEEYIQMLRSLSAVGRSNHAVELEKRAIHLLLEEGKELSRMKLLNVLEKASPD